MYLVKVGKRLENSIEFKNKKRCRPKWTSTISINEPQTRRGLIQIGAATECPSTNGKGVMTYFGRSVYTGRIS